jgi:hypothetical protein
MGNVLKDVRAMREAKRLAERITELVEKIQER